MRHFIGIDLGTTNSAICSFDGSATRVWKSPEQSDVTPSAIYVDRHGHRFYGRRAYDMAPADEKNAATLFKRYLGTSMKFTLEASGEELTPEECSAEILRLLYGYLPREWQEDSETVTVITVPAAFNQMKKDATLQAAQLAGIECRGRASGGNLRARNGGAGPCRGSEHRLLPDEFRGAGRSAVVYRL